MVMLVGFGGPCSRSFTLWVVKKEKSLPGCPAHGKMQSKGIANGISQILQDFGFLSKHKKVKHRKIQLLSGQEANTNVSQRCLALPWLS